jgi:sec-independent protein translocase protein TatC
MTTLAGSVTRHPDTFGPSSDAAPGTWRQRALGLLAVAAAAAQSMSFLDHLEELRKRLIWSLVFVTIAFGISWVFAGPLYEIASAPIRSNPAVILSLSRPQDIFGLYFKVTLVAAIFLSAPLVLWQVWLFVSPGLHPHERRYAIPIVLAASTCFGAGGAFGYFVAFPTALSFLLDWMVASHITPVIDATGYFDLFFSVVVALGLIFQIPVVIFVLSRFGLVTAGFLVKKLNYAVFVSAVVAALITPTQDPGNMLLIAGPMVVLYCVGIIVAWIFGRRRRRGTEVFSTDLP